MPLTRSPSQDSLTRSPSQDSACTFSKTIKVGTILAFWSRKTTQGVVGSRRRTKASTRNELFLYVLFLSLKQVACNLRVIFSDLSLVVAIHQLSILLELQFTGQLKTSILADSFFPHILFYVCVLSLHSFQRLCLVRALFFLLLFGDGTEQTCYINRWDLCPFWIRIYSFVHSFILVMFIHCLLIWFCFGLSLWYAFRYNPSDALHQLYFFGFPSIPLLRQFSLFCPFCWCLFPPRLLATRSFIASADGSGLWQVM